LLAEQEKAERSASDNEGQKEEVRQDEVMFDYYQYSVNEFVYF
jgi:hypothetical protein